MEDLKQQLGARADSEYALQEENRRLQVKRNTKKEKNFRKNEIQTSGGGDEGELREEETEHGERAALLQDEPPEQVKDINL